MGSPEFDSRKDWLTAETLRKWVRQAEINQGSRNGLTTSEREKLKQLERENRELNVQMRSCARLLCILPRRNSTADRSNSIVYR